MAEFARTFVLSMGGGSTREIASPEEAAAEIAAGALRRDTLVVAYEGGRGRSLRAGDAPELRPLFDAGLGAGAPRPEPSEPVAPAPADAGSPMPEAPAAALSAGPPPTAAKDSAAKAAPGAARRRGLGCGPTLLVWVLAMAAAVGLLSFCAQGGFSSAETAYVTRPTVLRAGPSAAAPARRDLPRGATVRGAPDRRDRGWFRASTGGGGWLWRRNLSARRRPALTGGPAPRRAATSAPLRAEAEAGAPVVGRVARGEALSAAGVTANGWVELRLPGGGVGYLRLEAKR